MIRHVLPQLQGVVMRGLKIATAAFCAAVWMGSFAQAQSLRAVAGPAELPPAGFTSDQYVDSRGCVFIRAGFGGVDSWVPRVGNNRKPICGQRASVAAAVPAAAAPVVVAAKPAPAVPVVVAAKPAPVAPAPVAAVAPQTAAPVPRVQARPAVSPQSYLPARVASASAAPAAPSGKVTVHLVSRAAQCPGPIEATAERQLSDGRRVVACGTARGGTPVYLLVGARPVAAQPVAAKLVQVAPVQLAAAAPARVAAPAPVARAAAPAPCGGLDRINQLYLVDDGRLVVKCGKGSTYLVVGHADLTGAVVGQGGAMAAPAPAAKVPNGYKLAWTDGRLSTTRGSRSAAGDAAMRLVWSDDTPRRLIDRSSGKDVTMDFAFLDYPFTSLADQQAGTARLSAKNAPTTAGTGRFVQAASFGIAANAAKAAASLKAAGLPVQVSSLMQNGKSLQIVLAGPFDTAQALTAGLAKTRASGFADAFTR